MRERLTKFGWNFEYWAVQKRVNLVISSKFFTFSQFYFQKFTDFSKKLSKIHEFWWKFSGFCKHVLRCPKISWKYADSNFLINRKWKEKDFFQHFLRKEQNLLESDSQISWDFTTEIIEFSENDFPKARQKVRKN